MAMTLKLPVHQPATGVLCACGCGEALTRRQVQRGGIYQSLSCARKAYLARPESKAVIQRCWAKAAVTNQRTYFARVRAEIIATCQDVLKGQEPTRAMLVMAARMHRAGYIRGWRARWGRDTRKTA